MRLSLQFVNSLSAIGPIQKVLRTEWPEPLVPFQLPHDLEFAVSQIHINPVARSNRTKRPSIQGLGNEVTDRNPVVGKRHTAVRNQHGQRCQGRDARSGAKVEFRHAGGMRPDSRNDNHDAQQFFSDQIVPEFGSVPVRHHCSIAICGCGLSVVPVGDPGVIQVVACHFVFEAFQDAVRNREVGLQIAAAR